jgi:hypothetical protein
MRRAAPDLDNLHTHPTRGHGWKSATAPSGVCLGLIGNIAVRSGRLQPPSGARLPGRQVSCGNTLSNYVIRVAGGYVRWSGGGCLTAASAGLGVRAAGRQGDGHAGVELFELADPVAGLTPGVELVVSDVGAGMLPPQVIRQRLRYRRDPADRHAAGDCCADNIEVITYGSMTCAADAAGSVVTRARS